MWWVLEVLPGFQQVLAGLGGLGRFLAGLLRSWCVSAGLGMSQLVFLNLCRSMTRGASAGLNGSQRVVVGPARSQSLLVHFSRT